jgi:hypothetical protein
MRPSASSPQAEQPTYLHRITAFNLVTNYFHLHPSRSFGRSVSIRLVARYRFVLSLDRSFNRSLGRSLSFVVSLRSFRRLMVVVGSLIWLRHEATGPVHHVEVQADRTGA